MPLYNAETKNSVVREQLTYNNRSIACKLFVTAGTLPTADADGWYITPGTVVKLVGDYTVAPCTASTDVPFGIVENGLSIADHAYKTPILGMPIGVIPFVFGQAIAEVNAPTAITAGTKAKFTNNGVEALASGDVAQCVVIKGSTAANTKVEVVF